MTKVLNLSSQIQNVEAMNEKVTNVPNTPPFKVIGIACVVCLILGFGILNPGSLPINSVVLAIGLMIFLCVARVPVTIALIRFRFGGWFAQWAFHSRSHCGDQ